MGYTRCLSNLVSLVVLLDFLAFEPAESSEKPAEVTEDQKYLREQTLQNTALSGKIDQLSDLQKKYNKPAIGKI